MKRVRLLAVQLERIDYIGFEIENGDIALLRKHDFKYCGFLQVGQPDWFKKRFSL